MTKFLNDTKIALIQVNEFTLESAVEAVGDLAAAADSSVLRTHVIINSDGGDTRALYAILDAINAFPHDLVATGLGTCGSSAADLLFGIWPHMRYAAPTAEFLIHGSVVSTENPTFWGMARRKYLENKYRLMTDSKLYDIISKRSCLSKAELIKKIAAARGEWIFGAREALEHGFVDAIGVPLMVDLAGGLEEDDER